MSLLRSNVLAAKARLAKGNEDFKRRHQAGCSGVEVCALATNLRDAVLLELVEAALADLGEAGPDGLLADIALVAHGGHGRRDVAPYSDVDLMILHRRAAAARVAPLAERLLRDVFDVGLILGHSVRTPWQACRLARQDSTICTSLMESRLLAGSAGAVRAVSCAASAARCSWRAGNLMATIVHSRRRRAGPLRRNRLPAGAEHQALAGRAARPAVAPLDRLRPLRHARSARAARPRRCSSDEDLAAIERAGEFLLWLRNELHFHAGQAADVLTRCEQLRIAAACGLPAGRPGCCRWNSSCASISATPTR